MLGWADVELGRAGVTGVALALMPTGTCYIGTYCRSGPEPGLIAINDGPKFWGQKGSVSVQLRLPDLDLQRPLDVDSDVRFAQVPVLPRRLGECAKSDPLLPFLVDPGTEGVRQDRLFREQAPNAPVRPDCLQDLFTSRRWSAFQVAKCRSRFERAWVVGSRRHLTD